MAHSGANRLVISDAIEKGKSEQQLIRDLENANRVAEQIHKIPTKERNIKSNKRDSVE